MIVHPEAPSTASSPICIASPVALTSGNCEVEALREPRAASPIREREASPAEVAPALRIWDQFKRYIGARVMM